MSLEVLLLTAASIALGHTLIGPDHYLPFIVLGRAEGWSLRKTLVWTAICGVGHVLSSVLLGLCGIALGWALTSMQRFEGLRGAFATWGLIGFGLLYFLWGMWRGWRGEHVHTHHHADGAIHLHRHHHELGADRPDHDRTNHEEPDHVRAHQRTVWTLVIIFLLGPCEPLIPLLMVPAARSGGFGSVFAVAGLFGVITVGTMLALVTMGHLGLRSLHSPILERYVHAMAGATLFLAGLAIQLLGV